MPRADARTAADMEDPLPQPLFETLEPRQFLSATPHTLLPALQAHTNTKVTRKVTSPTPAGLTPAQLRHAYGFDLNSLNGAGQTIAIVDAYDDPNIAADLAAFSARFNLPAMNQPGGPTFSRMVAKGTRTDPGWSLEIALDVEWAHAIAPQANILLVHAKTSSLTDLLSAVDYARNAPGVSVVSMSWGTNEFRNESAYDAHFTTPPGHTPVSFVAASGDTGAPLSWPAVSPNVLSVGGTTLAVSAAGNYKSESAWSGSTGGISAYVPKPTYQSAITQSKSFRAGPDLTYAADAKDGFAVYSTIPVNKKTGWFRIGGTSAGSPQVAALIAIANQGRSLLSLPTLDSAADLLPAIYAAPPATFHDITTGSSTGKPAYRATKGFDLATGRGSPFADSLIEQLLAA